MKKALLLFSLTIAIIFSLRAQMPEMFNYQAVLRNADGNVIANQSIAVDVEILQGSITGTSVFTETHSVTTSPQGVVSLTIGSVESLTGIDWSESTYFIKISVNGTEIGTSQLLTVPFALHAKTAENFSGEITETDPVFTAWDKSTGISITEDQITDLKNYITAESDPSVSSNFDFTGATTGDLLQFNGTKWVKVTPGYLTSYTETDPTFTAWDKSTGISITEDQITDLQNYIIAESDPAVASNFDFTGAATGDLLQFNGTKWVKVTPGYLTSYTENDPTFTAWNKSTGISITESQISDLKSYLTSESDPAVSANFDFNGAANGDLLQFNGTKWVKVTPNYLTGYTETDPTFTAWDKSTGIEITESQISDLKTYITSENDPAVSANFDFTGAANGDLMQFNGTKWVKVTPNYLTSYTETQSIADVAAIGNTVNTQLKNITNPTDAQDAATKAYVDELRTLLYLTADPSKLLNAGISVSELFNAGVSVNDLFAAGASVNDLLAAGASVIDLLTAGASVDNLLAAGASVIDLLDAGISIADLLNAGASITDLFSAGIGVGLLEQNGVTPQQLTDAGLIGTVTDIDGNTYKWVKIGTQIWMAENLKVKKLNHGGTCPYKTYPYTNIDGLNSDAEVIAAYGLLYNWYVVNSGMLCPTGWHVPTDTEWNVLINYLISIGYSNELSSTNGTGNSLRSCRQISSPLGSDCATYQHPRWVSGSDYGTDIFGFSALPGGFCDYNGSFSGIGHYSLWWSSTEYLSTSAWRYGITNSNVSSNMVNKQNSLSVRCIKD